MVLWSDCLVHLPPSGPTGVLEEQKASTSISANDNNGAVLQEEEVAACPVSQEEGRVWLASPQAFHLHVSHIWLVSFPALLVPSTYRL